MSSNRILSNCMFLGKNIQRRILLFRFRSTMVIYDEIRAKNDRIQELLDSMKEEVLALQKQTLMRKKKQLEEENMKLKQKVDHKRQELMSQMKQHGKQCIPVPGAKEYCTSAMVANEPMKFSEGSSSKTGTSSAKPKEKKQKKEKTTSTVTSMPEFPIDVGRLDMRVGKIIEVSRHPDADTLYVEKIDCGELTPRTVVSGLVKHVPIEQMRNRLVILLCNLKPAKMRGVTSEAMVMCASFADKLEVLNPPKGAVPGDLVNCEGYERQPDAILNPKKKIFETVAPDLMTNSEMVATYKGKPMYVPGKDVVKAQTLCNAQVK